MPEVIAPVEEVGALVMTLAGSGLQVKRTLGAAPGTTQSLITWNDATGDVTLRSGPEGASTLHLLSATVSIDALLTVTQIATFVTAIRLPGNSAAALQARNAANTAWVDLMYLGAADTAVIPRALSTQMLTTTQISSTGIIGANAGMQIGGAAPVGATATALFSFEAPVTRIYVGDGTGYSTRFSKRAGGVTTDLVFITDTGTVSAQTLVSLTGSILVAGSANPYLNLDDGSGASYVQVVAGSINLSPRNAITTISGALTTTGTVTSGGFYIGSVSAFGPGSITNHPIYGMLLGGIVGSQYDWAVVSPAGGNIITVPTGTTDVQFAGNVSVSRAAQATLVIKSTASNDAYLQFLGTATVKNWRLGKDISTGNAFDIQASATNGGTDFASVFILTNVGNLTLFGSLAAQNIVTVNRGSAASLLGYFGVFRLGNPIYYIGTNGADSGCILNAAATQDIIAWTNAGDLTLAGTFNANGPSGFAIGSVANRRRIQSTGVNSFSFLGDVNGFADVAMLTLLLTPAGVAAPVDCQLWTNGVSVFIRLGGVTKTFTLT